MQYVDLRSSRNLYIIGISLFFPLVLCQWIQKYPGAINTGIKELDGTLTVLLGTTILIGGFLGCFLDNVIPGTKEERGLTAWEKEMSLEGEVNIERAQEKSTYDFPYGMHILRKYSIVYSIIVVTFYTNQFFPFIYFLQMEMDILRSIFTNI